jgi:hypothetical protein
MFRQPTHLTKDAINFYHSRRADSVWAFHKNYQTTSTLVSLPAKMHESVKNMKNLSIMGNSEQLFHMVVWQPPFYTISI